MSGRTAAWAALYAAAIVLGRATRLDGTQLALVWPAAGVAFLWLAGSWGRPRRLGADVAVLVGVTVAGNALTGAPLALALAFGVANTVQGLVTCAVVFRLQPGPPRLSDTRGLAALAAGALVGSVASSLVGPAAVWVTTGGGWPVDTAVWIVRNAVSTLVVAAVGLRLAVDVARGSRAERAWEFTACTAAGVALYAALFGMTLGAPVAFLVLPLSVWVALRHSTTLAAVHSLVTGAAVVALTLGGHGPFAPQPPVPRVLLAQAFVAVATFITLVLALHRDHRQGLIGSLRSERDLTDAVLRTADVLVVVLDPQGRIARFNRACERVTGRTGSEVLGRPFWEVVLPGEEQAAVRETFGRLAAGDFPNHLDNHWRHVDGGLRRIAWSNTCLTGEDGRVEHVIGTGVDVTDQRRSDAALAEARDAAVDASRMKSAFLANMSHEIRTPMNGVIGMTELLLDTSLEPEQRGFAEKVRTSAEALLTIINDILDVSKIEAGKLELDEVEVELVEAVEDVCDLLAPQAHAKGIELAVHVDPAVPARLLGDSVRVRQILTNLASNAVKFTDRGEVVITAGAERGDDDRVLVRLEVRDTGIGVAPDVLPHLFEPFAQGDMAASRRFGGTGLGLAICRQLAELMGGDVRATSVLGAGSTFTVTLPLRVAEGDRRGRSDPRDDGGEDLLRGVRVLVVDDNATNREILLERLRGWGMRPAAAADAGAALLALHAAHEEGDPHRLAVLDFHMPGVDGLQLAERIQADARLAATPLVLLTSVGDHGAAARRAGIRACLTKPARQGTLRATLTAAVAGPRPADPQPAERPALPQLDRSLTVLVAEDNPVNQTVALQILRKRGLEVDLAPDGRHAVEMVERREYAAVFMDCQMPELDGYAATAEIRRRGHWLPIIAMTANAMTGDRETCLAVGMDDYLAKPLRADELDRALTRWLGRAGPGSGSRTSQPDAPLVDPSPLVELDDATIATEVVDLFARDAPGRISTLAAALAAHDRDAVHRAAHTLKGSAASVGATRLAALAGAAQNATADGFPADPGALVARLERTLAATTPALSAAAGALPSRTPASED